MKKILVLLFSLFLFSNVYSLELSNPGKITSHTNWSFSVEFDSTDSFDYADIFIGDNKIVTIYSNGNVIVDPINGNYVLKAFAYDSNPDTSTGLHLNVSYMGLESDTYILKVKSYNDGSIVAEDQGSLKIFNPLTSEYQEFTEEELEKLRELSEKLEQELEQVKEKSEELDELIEEKENQIEDLSMVTESLQDVVDTIESEQTLMQDSTKENLEKLKKDLVIVADNLQELKQTEKEPDNVFSWILGSNADDEEESDELKQILEQDKPKEALEETIQPQEATSGLFNLGNFFFPGLIILIIIGILIVASYVRNELIDFESKAFQDSPYTNPDADFGKKDNAPLRGDTRSRWAHGTADFEEETDTKINVGDLIKKK